MKSENTDGERPVSSSQTDGTQGEAMNRDSTSYHYVKYHGYAPDDFAEAGETTPFSGIRVVDVSGSGESDEFETFAEIHQSDWSVNTASSARLNDGTVLMEGQR